VESFLEIVKDDVAFLYFIDI